MKDNIVSIENDGPIVQRTNYYDTAQALRGEVYLTWNAGCARLLIPSSQRHLLTEMKCDHVVVTKKQHGIEILFDDLTDYPFMLVIAHQQNDRAIDAGDCLFSVYVKLGEKYQFPCKVIVEHGNTGKKNAKKKDKELAASFLHVRCSKADKAKWVKKSGGSKLSEWVIKTLNKAE